MNAYYNENQRMAAQGASRGADKKVIDFICRIMALLTCPVAIKIEKTIISAICFVALFGIVGGMDNGSVNLFVGILACLVLTLVEYCVLRSIFVKNKVCDDDEIELNLDELDEL